MPTTLSPLRPSVEWMSLQKFASRWIVLQVKATSQYNSPYIRTQTVQPIRVGHRLHDFVTIATSALVSVCFARNQVEGYEFFCHEIRIILQHKSRLPPTQHQRGSSSVAPVADGKNEDCDFAPNPKLPISRFSRHGKPHLLGRSLRASNGRRSVHPSLPFIVSQQRGSASPVWSYFNAGLPRLLPFLLFAWLLRGVQTQLSTYPAFLLPGVGAHPFQVPVAGQLLSLVLSFV